MTEDYRKPTRLTRSWAVASSSRIALYGINATHSMVVADLFSRGSRASTTATETTAEQPRTINPVRFEALTLCAQSTSMELCLRWRRGFPPQMVFCMVVCGKRRDHFAAVRPVQSSFHFSRVFGKLLVDSTLENNGKIYVK